MSGVFLGPHGTQEPSELELLCADMNGDGKINILDVLKYLIRLNQASQ